MVITLDTNVLVRIFIDDVSSAGQVKAARALAKTASSIYVPQLVQAELVWVLKSAYKLKKAQILVIIKELRSHSIFILQNSQVFAEAAVLYESGNADFADYLIMSEAKQKNTKMYTFDQQLVNSGANLCVG